MVLDPFCGCATALTAAENLGRKWVGIDLSPKAIELVNVRLKGAMGGLFHDRLVTARTDIPRRTDIEAPIPYRQNAHVLFGQQEGRCNGCNTEFAVRACLRSTMSFRAHAAGPTHIAICNCCVHTATSEG